METVLVIGSNCFTGSHIVDALLAEGRSRVVGVSRSPEYADVFLPYKNRDLSLFRFQQIDFRNDFHALERLLDEEKPAVVINVAALSEVALSNDRPVEYYETNTLSVVRLCEVLRKASYFRRYVHVSSAEIFGPCKVRLAEDSRFNPSTPYAVSKAAADMHLNVLIANAGFPATLIRSTNVYGAHQQLYKIIPRAVVFVKMGKIIKLHGGGRAVKNFIHIRDVVSGLIAALRKDENGTFHFSTDSNDTVADVVRHVCEQMGVSFEKTTRVVGERLGQDLRYWLDCTKAQVQLAWKPHMTFERGVGDVIRWIDSNWNEIQNLEFDYRHKV